MRNMLQNNFNHAIFFQGRCHVTQSNYSSTTNIDAWHFGNCLTESFFQILHLHFMAKWRSPSFKYRRGFDLFANIVKIQQRTPRRCSYFRFVSFRLSNLSKPEKIPEIWSSQLFDSIVSNSAHKLHHLLPLKQIQFRNQCNFKFRKMRTNRNTTTFIPFKSNR